MTRQPDRQINEHVCSTCGDGFSHKVWHCPRCDHHWLVGGEPCGNCYFDPLRGNPIAAATVDWSTFWDTP